MVMVLVDLCAVDQIGDDEVLKVELPGRPAIAVYKVDGAFFATDDLCTHGDASLSEGVIDDGQIICPYHGGMFDIRSGEATGIPCLVPLQTYSVSIEKGRVYADIS
jgi:nitrite reductase/ring-hydroxylating ferredoxin subunit